MSREFEYLCDACNKRFPWNTLQFQCECGGLLQVEFPECFQRECIDSDQPSMLRYLHAFPSVIQQTMRDISLGEGWTAAVALSGADPNVLVKMDHLMPTLSFKDRGAVVLVALAKTIGVERIVQDSSGNAGHAIATYAARAGIPCEIFVPEECSPKKIAMIEGTGGKVNVIAGSREDTADATLQAAARPGTFYASHVYNPLFYAGTRTYVFEILEQLGRLPERMILPLGNGTLVLGAARALKELSLVGISTKNCQVIAVQAENCAPIYQAFQTRARSVETTDNHGTAAEGIAIARPMRGSEVLNAVYELGGDVWVGREDDLQPTRARMKRLGFDIEPTTAASFAAFESHRTQHSTGLTVLPVCGAGIKK